MTFLSQKNLTSAIVKSFHSHLLSILCKMGLNCACTSLLYRGYPKLQQNIYGFMNRRRKGVQKERKCQSPKSNIMSLWTLGHMDLPALCHKNCLHLRPQSLCLVSLQPSPSTKIIKFKIQDLISFHGHTKKCIRFSLYFSRICKYVAYNSVNNSDNKKIFLKGFFFVNFLLINLQSKYETGEYTNEKDLT